MALKGKPKKVEGQPKLKGKPKKVRFKGKPKKKATTTTTTTTTIGKSSRATPVPTQDYVVRAEHHINSLLRKATLTELQALGWAMQKKSALDPREGQNFVNYLVVMARIRREQVHRDPFDIED